jgi:NhaP-type Na+/H+ or K+/H+ antiporter
MSTFAIFLMGIGIGFVIGYPFGLFIDKLDKKEKDRERQKYSRIN